MENILQEMRESIEKHLPAQVGEVLQKRLQQAERDAEKCVEFQNTVNNRNKEIAELKEKLATHIAVDRRLQEINEKLEELEAKERNLEVTLLKNQLKEVEKRNLDIFTLASIAFKNPTLKHSESNFTNTSIPYQGQYGMEYRNESSSENKTRTTEID